MEKRAATMTDRERVEALLRREKPDRVPLFPFAAAGFSMVYTKASIADAYNKPEVFPRGTTQDLPGLRLGLRTDAGLCRFWWLGVWG